MTTVYVQPNVNDDASRVHSMVCWRCTQPHVLGINDFITFSGVLLQNHEMTADLSTLFTLYNVLGSCQSNGSVIILKVTTLKLR